MTNPVGRRVGSGAATAALRSATAKRLRARGEEINDAVIHRALSIAPPSGKESPGYVEALRAAIPVAVEHAFQAIELGEERLGQTPAAILEQAAASARSGVGLDVVMRRYAAGYSSLSDFLHQEIRALVADAGPPYSLLQRELTALFDRLVVEVSEAYRREEARYVPSPRERRLERIRRLLAGELVDPAGLDYPLDVNHLAAVVSGVDAEDTAAVLAARLDRRLLVGEAVGGRWAIWLGGSKPFDREDVEEATSELARTDRRIALGEPGEGLSGWRRSRRQAEGAHLIVERSRCAVVRYRDVALLVAALRDPDLAHFLIDTFVEPLGGGSSSLGETLLSFLRLNGNASSTAASLGVSRRTVSSRLRVAEERIGGPIEDHAAEIATALRLVGLGGDSSLTVGA